MEKKIRPACASSISESFCHAFRSICQFAQNAGFLSIMGSAGPYDPALSYHDNFSKTSWTLNQQVKIASEYGLGFHVEPSRHSLLNTIPNALYMLELVPGLRYTLDFLHYQFSHTPLEESMKLLPMLDTFTPDRHKQVLVNVIFQRVKLTMFPLSML